MDTSHGLFKRCSCLDDVGRPLNSSCSRLQERGHGSWYFRVELPLGRNGRRRQLRRGGFSSRDAAKQACDYLRDPTVGDPSRALVSTAQWLQLWLDTRLGPRESTMQTYRHHVRNYLIPYLGGRSCGSSPTLGCRRCSPR
ncbi:Arm DNA-binding domain-containing protein [Amycolatopsis sp. H20-H5]|uniref:Arm DNA-binding domain-containing protein n=1 Tax=Amycolatopsis sp. H20-H5 TaxID=3046309 RepID=UPI003FA37883